MEIVVIQFLIGIVLGFITSLILIFLDNKISSRSVMVLVGVFVGYVLAIVINYIDLFIKGIQ